MNDRHDLAKLEENLFDHIEFDNAELYTEIQYRSSCGQALFRLFVELEQKGWSINVNHQKYRETDGLGR